MQYWKYGFYHLISITNMGGIIIYLVNIDFWSRTIDFDFMKNLLVFIISLNLLVNIKVERTRNNLSVRSFSEMDVINNIITQ